MRRLRVIASMCGVMMVCAGAALAEEAPTSDWSLKGLHLGASLADVQAAFPSLKCDVKPFDPALAYCEDASNQLAGEPAFLIVKLLDDKAVYISIENISYAQLQAAVPTLTEKLGAPAVSESIRGGSLEGTKIVYTNRNHYVWRSPGDASVVVVAQPFDWSDHRKNRTYSAITLMDENKHNGEWVVRFNNHGKRASDI